MDTEIIGKISGVFVFASAIPYAIRTLQRKIRPNITSWSLWSIIALALLLSSKSSGAEDNIWPAIFGFTNPCIVAAAALWRRNEWEWPTYWEVASVIGCLISLTLWWVVKNEKDIVPFALYLAMMADFCAYIPTLLFVWSTPADDRPGAWVMFSLGYGLGILAITEHSVVNYALPIYMSLGALMTAVPLALYRVRAKVPLAQWI